MTNCCMKSEKKQGCQVGQNVGSDCLLSQARNHRAPEGWQSRLSSPAMDPWVGFRAIADRKRQSEGRRKSPGSGPWKRIQLLGNGRGRPSKNQGLPEEAEVYFNLSQKEDWKSPP